MFSTEMMEIVGPALAAGLLIALTHAPLGLEVLRRGIIFIDLAVAQIAGLGLVASHFFLPDTSQWVLQAIALSSALIAGLFFRWIERRHANELEAIIGCCFILSASLALLLLADSPTGGEDIQHLLAGQILFVTWHDIFLHAPVYICILFLWFWHPGLRHGLAFYLLFALAITSSVQLAGVYVVFASLILPALAASNAQKPYHVAWLCGIAAVLMGILFSGFYDFSAGPLLVCSYVVTAIAIRIIRRYLI